jgi:hypothetical protein
MGFEPAPKLLRRAHRSERPPYVETTNAVRPGR